MVDFLRTLANLYSTATLCTLFIWYVVEDLSGLLPVPLSMLVLLDFMCGGVLIQKCWQETKVKERKR